MILIKNLNSFVVSILRCRTVAIFLIGGFWGSSNKELFITCKCHSHKLMIFNVIHAFSWFSVKMKKIIIDEKCSKERGTMHFWIWPIVGRLSQMCLREEQFFILSWCIYSCWCNTNCKLLPQTHFGSTKNVGKSKMCLPTTNIIFKRNSN